MYPALFFTNKDISLLKGQLDSKIRSWLQKYTLTGELDINISRAKFSDIEGINGCYLNTEHHDALAAYDEEDFSWENLIFSSLSNLCPRDSILHDVVANVKESFIKEIFGLSINRHELKKPAPSMFDTYLKIKISNNDAGGLTFFVRDCVFVAHIEKKVQLSPGKELQQIGNAVADINVPLTFSLDFGAIEFSEILKMGVGNVVVSTQKLENQISVSLCESSRAVAAMGKKNSKLIFILKS